MDGNSPLEKATPSGSEITSPTEKRVSPSFLDDLALGSFVNGSPELLVQHVREITKDLTQGTSPSRAGARRELVARALASEHVVYKLLQRLLGVHASKGNGEGTKAIEKALAGSLKRFLWLAEEHRHDMELERRPSVTVGGGNTIIDVGSFR